MPFNDYDGTIIQKVCILGHDGLKRSNNMKYISFLLKVMYRDTQMAWAKSMILVITILRGKTSQKM